VTAFAPYILKSASRERKRIDPPTPARAAPELGQGPERLACSLSGHAQLIEGRRFSQNLGGDIAL